MPIVTQSMCWFYLINEDMLKRGQFYSDMIHLTFLPKPVWHISLRKNIHSFLINYTNVSTITGGLYEEIR